MPDFGRWGANGGDPSLNAIARTDRYLDALSSEQPVYATDPADAELANLMAGWRDGVRRPPTRVAAQRDAEIVLARALATRRRTRMSMAVMGSVAAALLCLGGFGAVVYGAGPGDALYGLRVSLFGEQQVTRDDKVALAAQTEMQQVQQLIDQGNWDAAQDKLKTVTSTVQTVEDPQRQQDLQQQLNQLTVKVQSRDPDATVPEAAPVSVPPGDQPLPGISLPGISLPPGLPFPSLPGSGLPLPGSGVPLPGAGAPLPGIPGVSLPPLPDLPDLPLPGPGVPPNISLPPLPPLPKPLPGGLKPVPGDAKPDSVDPKPAIPAEPQPAPEAPKAAPKPAQELPKPAQELPKPVDQPKPLIPDVIPIPKPAPAPDAPPVQEAPPAPVIPVAPAPKSPPALAPAPQEEAPVENSTTTLFPMPAPKPPKGGN